MRLTIPWLPIKLIPQYIRDIDSQMKKHLKYSKDWYIFDKEKFLEDVALKLNKDVIISDTQKEILTWLSQASTKIYNDLVVWLNKMNTFYKDQWWYTIKYNILWWAFVEDLIWSFNWDLQFQYRRKWIFKTDDFEKSKIQFVQYLKDGAASQWTKFNDSRARQIYDYIFQREEWNAFVKFVKQYQWGYYFLNYQTWSLLLWGTWHIAGLSQIPWNVLEVKAFWRMSWQDGMDASAIIKKFKVDKWESVLSQWQSAEQLADTKAAKFQQWVSLKLKNWADEWMKWAWIKKDNEVMRNKFANLFNSSICEG